MMIKLIRNNKIINNNNLNYKMKEIKKQCRYKVNLK